MSLSDEAIPELDRKGLRHFGILTGGIIGVLFGILIPWIFGHNFPRWPWVFFGTLAVWGVLAPMSLRPVYRNWMRFGLIMSRITTPLIMGIVFYFVITPAGLIKRIFGNDSMAREFDDSSSYRTKSEKPSADRLKRPY